MDLEIRASDDDRQRTVAELQRHTEAGRLSLDEFAERVDAACAARTIGDLAAVTRDLPAEPVAVPPSGVDSRREFLAVFAIAAVTLFLLGLFMALTRGGAAV